MAGLRTSSARLLHSPPSRLWPASSSVKQFPVAKVITRFSLPTFIGRECLDEWKKIQRVTLEAVGTWSCFRGVCSDDVPGYGEDGRQSTPVTRSDKQEHDGKPHQNVAVRADKSCGSTLIRGRLQHQEAQGVEGAVPH